MTRLLLKRARLRAVAALGAMVLLLTSCGGSDGANNSAGTSEDSGDASPAGPLRIGTPWEIISLDPLTSGYDSSDNGYGELLLRPTATGMPEPWIAESASAISNNEWEITLHEGVTFHNGKPCDAEAIAAMMNHQLAENPLLEPVLPDAVAEATGPTTVTLTTTSIGRAHV